MSERIEQDAPLAPLLLTVDQAAVLLGMGRTYVYAMCKRGRIESVKLGGARRIPFAALLAYVEGLRAERPQPVPVEVSGQVPLCEGPTEEFQPRWQDSATAFEGVEL